MIKESQLVETITKAIMESGALYTPVERAIEKGDAIFAELSKDKKLIDIFFEDADIMPNVKQALNLNSGLKGELKQIAADIKSRTITISEEMINNAIGEVLEEMYFMPLTKAAIGAGKSIGRAGSNIYHGLQGVVNYAGSGNLKDNYKQGQADARVNKAFNGTLLNSGIKQEYLKAEKQYGGGRYWVMQEILKQLLNRSYANAEVILQLDTLNP